MYHSVDCPIKEEHVTGYYYNQTAFLYQSELVQVVILMNVILSDIESSFSSVLPPGPEASTNLMPLSFILTGSITPTPSAERQRMWGQGNPEPCFLYFIKIHLVTLLCFPRAVYTVLTIL